MGTPETALPALEALLAAGHDVPLVITQPDRPAGRGAALHPTPVKAKALERGLDVIQPVRVRGPEFIEAIAGVRPDVLAVVAYGRILPRPVLDSAPHGAINLHFSLLPAYRGAAPVQWALARGERHTGVTTFRIDDGLDTGDVLAQRPVAIAEGEHAPQLLARLADEGAMLLAETLAGIASGTLKPAPQDASKATLAPLLLREHGWWDPAWSAPELAGRAAGFDPWPGVWAARAGKRLRIADARAREGATTGEAPGTFLAVDGDAIGLACAAGTVALLTSLQQEGGRAMRAREAVNGRLISPGDRLERPRPAA